MMTQQNALPPGNKQPASKQGKFKKQLMSFYTELKYMKWMTFLHDFTYALLRASRQRSIMCLSLLVFFIFICFFLYLIFSIGNFWMHFCLMLTYVATLHLFKGFHVSVISQN